jgi:hypothetical protein
MVNAGLANLGPLRTGNALQKICRSSLRSWTRLLDR